MKKFLLAILCICVVSLPSFAIITPEEAKSDEYIKNHGYSNEMARLIDLQYSQINGKSTTYKSRDPEFYTNNKKVNFIRRLFIYLDCGLDDGKFGGHRNIDYSVRWSDI